MDLVRLQQIADSWVGEHPANRVPKEVALSPELAGLRLFEKPLLGVGDGENPYFAQCRDPKVVGPEHLAPQDWLPGGLRVVSVFLPFTAAVRESNRRPLDCPSLQWLHGRIEGQEFLESLAAGLRDALEQAGYSSAVPMLDPRCCTLNSRCNWSERHVAFACGLGTFGLSGGLITRRGMAGRLCSLITTCPLPVTARSYRDPMEYCTRCGACVRRCPAEAISLEGGKLHPPCGGFLDRVREKMAPYYGCGKCQIGVPCEDRIPDSPAFS